MATRGLGTGKSAATLVALTLVFALVAAACSSDEKPASPTPDSTTSSPSTTAPDSSGADTTTTEAPVLAQDRAYYVMPPGNFGGLPPTDDSLDQLPLYDGLTPLRGDVTDSDIENLFLREDFTPMGETVEEPTGREGTTILYDEFGVAHITGVTREDLAFGAGWVTARDRGLLVQLGRGPARVAVADVPGINAFELVTSGQQFVPSEAAEQLVSDQADLIVETYGDEGREIIADAQAYADGLTAYWEANGVDQPPATVNDVIAVTAFIGSIFGAGGGSEAANAEFLSQLTNALGDEQGRQAWEDLLLTNDPEAPTTIEERFDYGVLTGGEITGSVVIDEGTVESLDPRRENTGENVNVLYPAAGPVPHRNASNFLIVDQQRSVNDTTLAVMGPQLGYFYPEIVQQMHLSGPGIEAHGATVPGLAMYLLLGRTEDYAWSLTSANQDVRDVFAEVLCNADGSTPTRESTSYMFEGECVPFETFDAGTLEGVPIVFPRSVHGAVIGTALSQGEPVALTRQRSTFGRDGLNLAALKNMTEGDADTPEAFFEVANQFGFTFNWGYANRTDIAYFASGYLPERAPGLDRRLPTLGTGEYEWTGFLDQDEHPHAAGHPSGRLLNWNNQSAPGFMHGDGNQYGSLHRVELFDQFPDEVELAGVVGVMNRSATEDTRSPLWPIVSEVLRGGDAPTPLAAQVVDILDSWVADDAPRLDADDDGNYDHAGPLLLDSVWGPIGRAVVNPVFGTMFDIDEEEDDDEDDFPFDDGIDFRGISEASLIDKDLRTLLGHPVEGEFNLAYCGNGTLEACRASLWAAIDGLAQALSATLGDDPSLWLAEGNRSGFAPGLIPETFRETNRPTFQQVVEFAPSAPE